MNLHYLTKLSEVETTINPEKTPNSCKNCGTVITCGCQRLVASDGVEVCDECVTLYEEKLA